MFYDDNTCSTISCKRHKLNGTDNHKIKFLQDRVNQDLQESIRYKLKKPTTIEQENVFARLNKRSHSVLEAFKYFGIAEDALVVITPVKNNEITFSSSVFFSDNYLEHINKNVLNLEGEQLDWLSHYKKGNTFDLPQLINDDFFSAIKLTFQHGMYLSSMKLLMSCIDSIGYIEFGHLPKGKGNVFKNWLEEYADLKKINITPSELWELRNGILHMSNLESQSIKSGKVRCISFFVGQNKEPFFAETENVYYFNFIDLIKVYSEALSNWIQSYNEIEDKFLDFIQRYDKTVSDNRLFYQKVSNQ